MSLNEKNNPVVLNSGSITNPDNRHSLQFFSKQVREDLLKIENYINDVAVQIFRTAADTETYNDDAITDGISGKTIITNLSVEPDDAEESAFWDSNRKQQKTIYESFTYIVAKLNEVIPLLGEESDAPDLTSLSGLVSQLFDIVRKIKNTISPNDQEEYKISVTIDDDEYTNIHDALNKLKDKLQTLTLNAGVVSVLNDLDDVNTDGAIVHKDLLIYDIDDEVFKPGKIDSSTLTDGDNLLKENDTISKLTNDENYIKQAAVDTAIGNLELGARTVNGVLVDVQRNIALDATNIEAGGGFNPANYTLDGNTNVQGHLAGIDTELGELANSNSGNVFLMEDVVDRDRFEGGVQEDGSTPDFVLKLIKPDESFSIKRVFLDISGDVTNETINPANINNNCHLLKVHLGEVIPNTCVELYPYNSVDLPGGNSGYNNADPDIEVFYDIKPFIAPTGNSRVYCSYTGITNMGYLDSLEGNRALGNNINNNINVRGRISKITFNVVSTDLVFVTIHIMNGQTLYR